MALPVHSKIINNIARETFKPLGIIRKGQSRTWLDDHGWWVTIIEFQPSRWDKGTYLNVGINWQWYPNEHISFDLGYRESGFVKYETEDRFKAEAADLLDIAKDRVLEIRENMSSPDKARRFVLENTEGDERHIWSSLNKGMICYVTGEKKLAVDYFEKAAKCQDDRGWAIDAKEYVKRFMSLSAPDQMTFLESTIQKSRSLKKLNKMDVKVACSA